MGSGQNNQKVEIQDSRFGRGLFASQPIKKDGVIAILDGEIFERAKASDLPLEVRNHAIQFASTQYRNATVATMANHSCEPNAGWGDTFQIIAMRNIEPGEEILLDYDMSEDSDWVMECYCGTQSCRKIIGSFSNLSDETKRQYGKYVASWLRTDRDNFPKI
jgi:hypothetical protein